MNVVKVFAASFHRAVDLGTASGRSGRMFRSTVSPAVPHITTLPQLWRHTVEMPYYPTLAAVILTACASTNLLAADKPSVDDLVAALSSDDPSESGEAAVAIGNLEEVPAPALAALVTALSDKRTADRFPVLIPAPRKRVADYASDALVAIGERGVDPLSELLAGSEDQATRILALKTLARIGRAASVAVPVVEDELDDRAYEVRFYAVHTLAAIQHDEARLVASLRGALSDQSPHVRAAAIQRLGELGQAAISAVPDIERLLDDRDVRWHSYTPDMVGTRPVRYDAAMALGKIGNASPTGLPKLRRMMRSDEDALAKTASAFAVVAVTGDDAEAMNVLVSLLGTRDSGDEAAAEAADVLAMLGNRAEPAIGALERALNHPDALVRISAADALVAVDPDEAERRLLPLLNDSNDLVRSAVIEELGGVPAPSEKLIAALMSALDDEGGVIGADVRHAAAVALGKAGARARDAVPRLNRLAAEDDSDWVRNAAATAVEKINGSHEDN